MYEAVYQSVDESMDESVDGCFAPSPAMMSQCLKGDIFRFGLSPGGEKGNHREINQRRPIDHCKTGAVRSIRHRISDAEKMVTG